MCAYYVLQIGMKSWQRKTSERTVSLSVPEIRAPSGISDLPKDRSCYNDVYSLCTLLRLLVNKVTCEELHKFTLYARASTPKTPAKLVIWPRATNPRAQDAVAPVACKKQEHGYTIVHLVLQCIAWVNSLYKWRTCEHILRQSQTSTLEGRAKKNCTSHIPLGINIRVQLEHAHEHWWCSHVQPQAVGHNLIAARCS